MRTTRQLSTATGKTTRSTAFSIVSVAAINFVFVKVLTYFFVYVFSQQLHSTPRRSPSTKWAAFTWAPTCALRRMVCKKEKNIESKSTKLKHKHIFLGVLPSTSKRIVLQVHCKCRWLSQRFFAFLCADVKWFGLYWEMLTMFPSSGSSISTSYSQAFTFCLFQN